jgi:hypothetical protein
MLIVMPIIQIMTTFVCNQTVTNTLHLIVACQSARTTQQIESMEIVVLQRLALEGIVKFGKVKNKMLTNNLNNTFNKGAMNAKKP